jgi:hypothetical protein
LWCAQQGINCASDPQPVPACIAEVIPPAQAQSALIATTAAAVKTARIRCSPNDMTGAIISSTYPGNQREFVEGFPSGCSA